MSVPIKKGNVVPLRASMPQRLTDEGLVAALRAGDKQAALELYRRYARDAERMLVRVLGHAPERADLLHDVFVRVLEGITSLREASAVRPWVMGIAIRRAQEHLRQRKRHPVREAIDEGAPGRAEASLELHRVYLLLDAMDETDRVCFLLRKVEGMELSEIAETCDISLATVKRRIQRAEEDFAERSARDPILAERMQSRNDARRKETRDG